MIAAAASRSVARWARKVRQALDSSADVAQRGQGGRAGRRCRRGDDAAGWHQPARTFAGTPRDEKKQGRQAMEPWSPAPGTSRLKRSPFAGHHQLPFAAIMRRQADQHAGARPAADGAGGLHEHQHSTPDATPVLPLPSEDPSSPPLSDAGKRASPRGRRLQKTRGPAGKEPECRLATLIRTVPEAEQAVKYLSQRTLMKNIFAVDTETEGIDPTAESPVGNGRVVCFSIYCGPGVDFSGLGETLDLSDVAVKGAAAGSVAYGVHKAADDVTLDQHPAAASAEVATEIISDQESDAAAGSTSKVSRLLVAAEPKDGDKKRETAGKSKRLWVDTAGEDGEAVMDIFKKWLENRSFKKVFHNWSFDSHMFANHGVHVKGFSGDTMHMGRLWDSSRALTGGGYKLSSLCNDLLGWGKTDMKAAFGRHKPKSDGSPGKAVFLPSSLDLQTDGDVEVFRRWVHYSTFDSLCTYYLYFKLRKELESMAWKPDAVMSGPTTPFASPRAVMRDPSARPGEPSAKLVAGVRGRSLAKERNLLHFYEKCWRPFGEILTHIERNGVFVDTGHLLRQAELAEQDKLIKEDVFRRWAAKICPDGCYLNARSVTQKRHLLFSSQTVEMVETVKHTKAKRTLKQGETVELAYKDAEELIASGAARATAADSAHDTSMKTFTVENKERLLEAGRTTPKATREISLRGLGLRPVAYTATGAPSTSGAVISQLAGKPFADPPKYGSAYKDLGGGKAGQEVCEALGALIESESIDKLLSTFLRTLPKMTDKDSRIHTALNLNTETGRLSSMRPNLQNQPALEKDVYGVRRAFSAQKGNKLIVVDYGQLELRIMAHMTRCKSMIEAFELGGDFHSRTAIDMYPHVKDAVDRQEVLLEWNKALGEAPAPMLKDKYGSERRKAKTLNFSIAYGKTKTGLANDWGVSVQEAHETILAWYDARKEVKDWQDAVKVRARKFGYTGRCTTLLYPLVVGLCWIA